MVLQRLRDYLREEEELQVGEVLEFFENRRKERIEAADERVERFRERAGDRVEAIQRSLDDLEAYSDPDAPDVVNDVVQSMAVQRKNLIKRLELPGEPGALVERLEDFVEEFQTLTMKQQEVVKRAGDEVDAVFEELGELKDLVEEMEAFLDGEHESVERYDAVKDAIERKEQAEEDIEDLQDKLSGLGLEKARGELDDLEKEKDELDDRDEWSELSSMEERLDGLEERRTRLRAAVQQPFSRLERGLKKLLYAADDGKLEMSREDIGLLKELRDEQEDAGEVDEDALERIADAVEASEVLEGKDEETFLNALEGVKEVPSRREELAKVEEEIRDLEEDIENFELKEEREKLQDRIEESKERLSRLEERQEELEKKIEDEREEIESLFEEIEEILNEEFRAEIDLYEA